MDVSDAADVTAPDMHVSSVRIDGVCHTSHDLLASITAPLLAQHSLPAIADSSARIVRHLQLLGIFKAVSVVLDTPDAESSQNLINVVFTVVEAPRLYAKTGVDFGSTEGSMNLSLNLRNVLGKAESLALTSTYGAETSSFTRKNGHLARKSVHQLVLTKPIGGDPRRIAQVTVYAHDRDNSNIASHFQALKGISAKHTWDISTIQAAISYSAGCGIEWREAHSLSTGASLSVRKDAGHSLCSSITQSLTYDTRDDIVLPTAGLVVRLSQQLAGFGGNVSFLKTEADAGITHSLQNRICVTGSVRAGLLVPLSDTCPPRINDRFRFGGPLSIRGFSQAGLGPKDRYAIGGDAYYGASLAFQLPIYKLPYEHIRAHVFANTGSLVSIFGDTQATMQERISKLAGIPSTSVGLGIAARFAGFRLELNYCAPVIATSSDGLVPGFQFGIGLEFM